MTIEYSGYITCDPENTFFVAINDMDNNNAKINGVQYMELSEDDRGKYILENFGDAYKASVSGDGETNVIVENDDE